MTSDATMVTLAGATFVILPAAEYERLRARSRAVVEKEDEGPLLPKPDARGRFPAIAYWRASLARKIIRRRRTLGISQSELARRAGLRVETLNRLEKARTTPSIVTVEKIDRALRTAEGSGPATARMKGKATRSRRRTKRR
jgi:ribosome-binding protein aMBF1 (putative translation factor)